MSKSKEPPFSAEYLRSVLDYDPTTGEFRWKWRDDVPACWNTRYARKIAGCSKGPAEQNRWKIAINDRAFHGHKLAWFHYYGDWPSRIIDHINGDASDNRIANLRLVNETQSVQNRGISRNNTTGHKGVTYSTTAKRWRARIGVNYKEVMTYHDTFESAVEGRLALEREFFGRYRRDP